MHSLCVRGVACRYLGWGGGPSPLEPANSGDLPNGGTAGAASQAGYELLMRSITCMLCDKAHAFGLQLRPGSWTAAAWLVVFTAGEWALVLHAVRAHACSATRGRGGGGSKQGGEAWLPQGHARVVGFGTCISLPPTD